MKNSFLFFSLLLTVSSFAQSGSKKADRLFERMWYKEAAVLYENALKGKKFESTDFIKDNLDQEDLEDKENEIMTLLQKAGDSYFFNTDMINAGRWYELLINRYEDEVAPEYLFRYAHTLEGQQKYKEAKQWMKKFSRRSKQDDARKKDFSQKKETLNDVLEITPAYSLKNVSVNTPNSDFGPMYFDEQLIYSSAIDSSTFHTRIYHWNEQPFLNMYLGKLNKSQSNVTRLRDFSKKLNTRYHEATVAFSPDQNTMYFTRNNYDGTLKRDDKGTNHLKLYRTQRSKGKDKSYIWSDPVELPFNSENYSVGHPTINADGTLLYFVSDMPGSIGGTDIFVVDIKKSSASKNNDKPLKNTSYTYSKPRNLGPLVNTAGREMFPFITPNGLYLASDGHLGLGGLDVLYSTLQNQNFTEPINLGAPLNSTRDDFGFILHEEGKKGFVCSNREGGKGDDDIYSFTVLEVEEAEDPLCNQAVNGYVSNTLTGERINAVTLVLKDKNDKELATTTSDLNGYYAFPNDLPCNTIYKVYATKTGYAEKDKTLKTLKTSGETEVPLGLNTLNKLIVEENGILKIKIGIIYFDLDKSYIRASDAQIELNKVVLLMTEYPKMKIRIESHTDSRSSDAYNLALSDRRAKATRNYIVSQGINQSRIESAKGFGETQLINRCSNGVPCTEAEHQFNRRSEFIITGI